MAAPIFRPVKQKQRQTRVVRTVIAGCLECGGTGMMWHGPQAQGTAAKHHDQTGHATWADVTMNVRYGR